MSMTFNKLVHFINASRRIGRKIFTRKLFYHEAQIPDEKRERANYSNAISSFLKSGVIRRYGSHAYVIA
nr:hypothetical protein [Candidatus Sigynarchaeota archaeon]